MQHLQKKRKVDHQARRAFLEIFCLTIINGQRAELKTVLEKFLSVCPDAYDHPEYNFAENIEQILSASGGQTDWKAVLTITKKPAFSAIINEITKQLKIRINAEIESEEVN